MLWDKKGGPLGGGPGGSLGFRSLPYCAGLAKPPASCTPRRAHGGQLITQPRDLRFRLPVRKSPSTVDAYSPILLGSTSTRDSFSLIFTKTQASREYRRTLCVRTRPPSPPRPGDLCIPANAAERPRRGCPVVWSSLSQRRLLVKVSSCMCVRALQDKCLEVDTSPGKENAATTPRLDLSDPTVVHLDLGPLAPCGLFCEKRAKSSGGVSPSGCRSEAPLSF